jgi:hypothetical protein
MNYAPAVTPKSGDYIMEGLRMSQNNADLAARLMGYFFDRSNRKEAAAATLEALASDSNGPALSRVRV